MDLKSTQLKDTYGNLLTIGTTAGSPTTGTLENGDGEDITSLDVNGTITSDGLTVDGSIVLNNASAQNISFTNTAVNPQISSVRALNIDIDSDGDQASTAINFTHDNGAGTIASFNETGDVSFRDTSNNEAFYWDASTARLGIGTTSPSHLLHLYSVDARSPSILLENNSASDSDVGIIFAENSENYAYRIGIDDSGNTFRVTYKSGGIDPEPGIDDDRLVIDSSGNVGIGTDSPDAPLVIEESAVSQTAQAKDIAVFKRNGDGYLKVYSPNTDIAGLAFGDTDDAFIGAMRYHHATDHLDFYVNNDERMRIDSSGYLRLASAGIQFNGDTASANALDDYEEGTFDATIYEVGGSDILVEPDANYVKIGSLVHIQVRALGGTTGTSGVVRMNLPFTQSSKGGANIVAYSVANGNIVSVFCVDGVDYLEFVDTIGSIASANKSIGSDWGATSRLYFNFTYSTT